jgi:hypothetical protein
MCTTKSRIIADRTGGVGKLLLEITSIICGLHIVGILKFGGISLSYGKSDGYSPDTELEQLLGGVCGQTLEELSPEVDRSGDSGVDTPWPTSDVDVVPSFKRSYM